MSELFVKGNDDTKEVLLVSFGGLANLFGGMIPFEFLNFLKLHFGEYDRYFYIDKHQVWYHKGLSGITTNTDETIAYLGEKIKGYSKVIFIGVSAGGYAALLYGSLLGVSSVLAFIPQTRLVHTNNLDVRYIDIKPFINSHTAYTLCGSATGTDLHDISHCKHIEHFANVNLITRYNQDMKELRDSGYLKNLISQVINNMPKNNN